MNSFRAVLPRRERRSRSQTSQRIHNEVLALLIQFFAERQKFSAFQYDFSLCAAVLLLSDISNPIPVEVARPAETPYSDENRTVAADRHFNFPAYAHQRLCSYDNGSKEERYAKQRQWNVELSGDDLATIDPIQREARPDAHERNQEEGRGRARG